MTTRYDDQFAQESVESCPGAIFDVSSSPRPRGYDESVLPHFSEHLSVDRLPSCGMKAFADRRVNAVSLAAYSPMPSDGVVFWPSAMGASHGPHFDLAIHPCEQFPPAAYGSLSLGIDQQTLFYSNLTPVKNDWGSQFYPPFDHQAYVSASDYAAQQPYYATVGGVDFAPGSQFYVRHGGADVPFVQHMLSSSLPTSHDAPFLTQSSDIADNSAHFTTMLHRNSNDDCLRGLQGLKSAKEPDRASSTSDNVNEDSRPSSPKSRANYYESYEFPADMPPRRLVPCQNDYYVHLTANYCQMAAPRSRIDRFSSSQASGVKSSTNGADERSGQQIYTTPDARGGSDSDALPVERCVHLLENSKQRVSSDSNHQETDSPTLPRLPNTDATDAEVTRVAQQLINAAFVAQKNLRGNNAGGTGCSSAVAGGKRQSTRNPILTQFTVKFLKEFAAKNAPLLGSSSSDISDAAPTSSPSTRGDAARLFFSTVQQLLMPEESATIRDDVNTTPPPHSSRPSKKRSIKAAGGRRAKQVRKNVPRTLPSSHKSLLNRDLATRKTPLGDFLSTPKPRFSDPFTDPNLEHSCSEVTSAIDDVSNADNVELHYSATSSLDSTMGYKDVDDEDVGCRPTMGDDDGRSVLDRFLAAQHEMFNDNAGFQSMVQQNDRGIIYSPTGNGSNKNAVGYFEGSRVTNANEYAIFNRTEQDSAMSNFPTMKNASVVLSPMTVNRYSSMKSCKGSMLRNRQYEFQSLRIGDFTVPENPGQNKIRFYFQHKKLVYDFEYTYTLPGENESPITMLVVVAVPLNTVAGIDFSSRKIVIQVNEKPRLFTGSNRSILPALLKNKDFGSAAVDVTDGQIASPIHMVTLPRAQGLLVQKHFLKQFPEYAYRGVDMNRFRIAADFLVEDHMSRVNGTSLESLSNNFSPRHSLGIKFNPTLTTDVSSAVVAQSSASRVLANTGNESLAQDADRQRFVAPHQRPISSRSYNTRSATAVAAATPLSSYEETQTAVESIAVMTRGDDDK